MRFVDLDGNRVAVHVEGVPDAAHDIILIHGAGSDHTSWRFQTRYLAARGNRVFALDLPGHGRSNGAGLASIPEMASWLLRIIEMVDARAPTLIGHSMGSLIALESAASRPEALSGTILIASSDRMAVHPELLSAAADRDDHAVQLMTGWMHTGDQAYGGHRNPGTWSAGLSRRHLEHEVDVLHLDLAACTQYDPMTAAPNVTTPTLVISGVADRMTPCRSGESLAKAIEGANFVSIPGAGHMLISEASDRVNHEIVQHLGALIGSR